MIFKLWTSEPCCCSVPLFTEAESKTELSFVRPQPLILFIELKGGFSVSKLEMAAQRLFFAQASTLLNYLINSVSGFYLIVYRSLKRNNMVLCYDLVQVQSKVVTGQTQRKEAHVCRRFIESSAVGIHDLSGPICDSSIHEESVKHCLQNWGISSPLKLKSLCIPTINDTDID